MQKNKIEVALRETPKTMYVPLSVFRSGKRLAISFPGKAPDDFKFSTSEKQLQQFAGKLEELFAKYVGA